MVNKVNFADFNYLRGRVDSAAPSLRGEWSYFDELKYHPRYPWIDDALRAVRQEMEAFMEFKNSASLMKSFTKKYPKKKTRFVYRLFARIRKLRFKFRGFRREMRWTIRRTRGFYVETPGNFVTKRIWSLISSFNKALARPTLAFKLIINKMMALICKNSDVSVPLAPLGKRSRKTRAPSKRSLRLAYRSYDWPRGFPHKIGSFASYFEELPKFCWRRISTGFKNSRTRIKRFFRRIRFNFTRVQYQIRFNMSNKVIYADLEAHYPEGHYNITSTHSGVERFHSEKRDRRRITMAKYIIREMYRVVEPLIGRQVGVIGFIYPSIIHWARKRTKEVHKHRGLGWTRQKISHNGCLLQKDRRKRKIRRGYVEEPE